MKLRYLILLVILAGVIVIAVVFGSNNKVFVSKMQATGGMAALFAAIVALAVADKKKLQVKIKMESYIKDKGTEDLAMYEKSRLSPDVQYYYKDLPNPIESFKVAFEITNQSSFDLKKPFVTFKLPDALKHPVMSGSHYDKRDFHSNIHNSPGSRQVLEFDDTYIISNSNVPYLNSGDKITYWFRMVLSKTDTREYEIEISVNCENANGVTKKIVMTPFRYIESRYGSGPALQIGEYRIEAK